MRCLYRNNTAVLDSVQNGIPAEQRTTAIQTKVMPELVWDLISFVFQIIML
jgi:hypothetical protein